ncbi:alpha/beta-hydrolase [Ramaria rubella]|nr:alpha/beta-hydrolase [Ramaria rubella]
MHYAAPPIGPLRLNIPHPPPYVSGIQNATAYGAACIQLPSPPSPNTPPLAGTLLSSAVTNQGEDCLFVNVIRPSNISSNTSLPVLFWIYGGGFEVGDARLNDGTPMVERSIALGEPIVYVSLNYRINAYGFLASKEIQAAGVTNLGLRDRESLVRGLGLQMNVMNRSSMRWSGSKVTLIFSAVINKRLPSGENLLVLSVGYHLVGNGGDPKGRFRGAIMNSGSPPSTLGPEPAQKYYDLIAKEPTISQLNTMITKTPNILSKQGLTLAYEPRVDGDIVKENPQDSIAKGKYAKVPLISGDCEDEETLFSTTQNLK